MAENVIDENLTMSQTDSHDNSAAEVLLTT